MLAVIEQQAQRLSRMVEALLDISRIRNGTLSLEHESFDLNGLAERIIDEIQPSVERHTIYLKTIEGPINIVGDGLRLEQVFQNLIQNAIKYSPRGGRITVEIRPDQKKKEVVVSISDQGIGIPAKALPNLFRQFFRADNTSSYQISGMGLGLFVVREIISLHNGRVDVDSIEGKGSTFHVYLPYSESEQKVATANTDNDGAIAASTSVNEVGGISPSDFISAVNMATG
jgi:signal transduction histidine kinase